MPRTPRMCRADGMGPRARRRLRVAAALAVLGCVGLPPAAGQAEDLVVLGDGGVVRVESAEVLPDRVRIVTQGHGPLLLPNGTRLEPTIPGQVELPRRDVLAVFPESDLPAAVRSQAERTADTTLRLSEQAHRDLQRSWNPPAAGAASPPWIPSPHTGPAGSLPPLPGR